MNMLLTLLQADAGIGVGGTVFFVLALLLAIPLLVLEVSALVFTVFYAFKYDRLRDWFNRKCGADCIPAKRLNALLKAPLKAVVVMVALNLAAQWLAGMTDPESAGRIVVVAVAVVAVVGVPVVILRAEYRKHRDTFGQKAARWMLLYALFSIAAIYTICMIAVYLILLVVALYVLCFVLKQTGPGRALDMSDRHCSNCSKFGHSSCPHDSRSGSGCCDSHSW